MLLLNRRLPFQSHWPWGNPLLLHPTTSGEFPASHWPEEIPGSRSGATTGWCWQRSDSPYMTTSCWAWWDIPSGSDWCRTRAAAGRSHTPTCRPSSSPSCPPRLAVTPYSNDVITPSRDCLPDLHPPNIALWGPGNALSPAVTSSRVTVVMWLHDLHPTLSQLALRYYMYYTCTQNAKCES